MKSIDLHLLSFKSFLRVKAGDNNNKLLFDPIRSKWLVLEPEEMVRQLVLQFLLQEKNYNRNRIQVEQGLEVVERKKRTDVVVLDPELQPFLLIECKAPQVRVDEKTFHQIANYYMSIKVPYLMLTNGIQNYICEIDANKGTFKTLDFFPAYPAPKAS